MIVANCNSQLRTVRFAMVDGGWHTIPHPRHCPSIVSGRSDLFISDPALFHLRSTSSPIAPTNSRTVPA